MGGFPLPETEVGVQAPVGQSVSPSPGQWDMMAALVTRGPPSSTPHRAGVHSGLIPRTQFGQPDRGGPYSGNPIPAGVAQGLEEISRGPHASQPIFLPPWAHPPPSTLHPGTGGAFPQRQGGLEQGLWGSGHAPDTWHLPTTAACLPGAWPG